VLITVDDVTDEAGQHLVSFYDQDAALATIVGSFLGAGLAAGEAALVVGTHGHRAAFDTALEAAGIDVAEVRASGQYVSLDAGQLLSTFLRGGQPDPFLFQAAVGDRIAELRTAGRRVRVFGEMVALLWDEGAVTAAMALEQLWGDLLGRTEFTLLCAYPQRALESSNDGGTAICGHHHAVVAALADAPTPTPGRMSRRFEPTASSAAAARRFVTDALRGWEREDLVAAAQLVVSELAGNALRHSYGRFHVTVLHQADGVRVAVTDRSPALPTGPTMRPEVATDGRGMQLIDALARRWGADAHRGGKTVWAELTDPGL
jgi:anti-sigma regulatory factor (Ser/Thr protein kinase)